jgi:hypothetical protein
MEQMPVNFQNCRKSLRDTSYDSDEKTYMCVSTLPVFNFDKLKDWYVATCAMNVKQVPCSVDALWLDEDHIVLIEFKNGKIGPTENNEIIFKIYDSLLLIFDAKIDLSWCRSDFKPRISYTRENMDYIVVYNKEKYDERHPTPQTRKGLERQQVQESLHRTMIFKAARGWANKRVVLFGLDRFKGYLFRQVYTLNQDEFQKYLVEQGVM